MKTKGSSKPKVNPGLSAGSKQDAVIFAVMGTTGSGKSTFIQMATGRQDIPIGHQWQSCTEEPHLYDFSFDGRPAALLDTPGFDDTYKTDAEVLESVADFLASTYQNQIRLSGIVYLQRIIDPRMTHGGRANLAMFRALCGDDPLRKVVLATTFWGEVKNLAKAKVHEEELSTNKNYWGDMISKKATMTRFHDTQESALKILRGLLEIEEQISLKIQQEMVDQKLNLANTSAGETLGRELNAMAERYAKDLERHKLEMNAALKARDVELQEVKEEQARKTEELLQVMYNQKEVLNARRRDEVRIRDMEFDARLRKMLHEQTEDLERLETEMKQTEQAVANAKNSEHERQKLLTIKEQHRLKREKLLGIAGAIGTTATAAGLAVINPLAIPVAFGGLINLINSCFSYKERKAEHAETTLQAAVDNLSSG